MTTSLPLEVATTVLANFFSSADRLRSDVFLRLAAPVGEIPTFLEAEYWGWIQ